jgi:hypothetical protein
MPTKMVPDNIKDQKMQEGERALLIVHDVACYCGHTWTDSEIIFRSNGYSYHLTQARFDALVSGDLTVEGKRFHTRLVPICHSCRGASLPTGWKDSPDADPYDPALFPDKNQPRRARFRPPPSQEDITTSILSGLDEDEE